MVLIYSSINEIPLLLLLPLRSRIFSLVSLVAIVGRTLL